MKATIPRSHTKKSFESHLLFAIESRKIVTMTNRKAGGVSPPSKQAWSYIRSNLLPLLTILSIIFGITFGLILRSFKEDEWSQREQVYVKFGGEIFLRMLKALSLPLILSSMIAALGSFDLRLSGKVGMRTALFYLLTTVCAVFLGIILVVSIHPGSNDKDQKLQQIKPIQARKILSEDVMMDMVRNMFPSNLVQATLFQYQTIVDIPTLEKIQEKLQSKNESLPDSALPTKSRYSEGTNMLGLLVFSTVFGIALASLGNLGKPLLKLIHSLSQILMIISSWVLWLAPIGIFCLLAGTMVEIHDVEKSFEKSGMFVFTVLLGLLLHGFVVLPGVYFLISGTHPFKLIGTSVQALTTAFGTSSSIATLPATVSCVEENHGVDPRIARFVLPVGAAMNMDGTALYQAAAAFFLVQLHGVSMDFGSIVAVSFIATISSIGASGIPHAGVVILTMLTNVLGVPVESISLIMAVDWILHRFRTMVNVLGDILAANLVGELSSDELDSHPISKTNPKELEASAEDV